MTIDNAGTTGRALTHEGFLHAVRELVVSRLNEDDGRRLSAAKLVYGSGEPGTRGVCFFDAWHHGESHDFIEVCAAGEESLVQIIGTAIHEFSHALVGHAAGHGHVWKQGANRLGLWRALAAGQDYRPEDFDPELWKSVQALPTPQDGRPSFHGPDSLLPLKPRSCPLGIGTNGGRSRGKGSGSRLRLYVCGCVPAVRVRVARDDFRARCLVCEQIFERGK